MSYWRLCIHQCCLLRSVIVLCQDVVGPSCNNPVSTLPCEYSFLKIQTRSYANASSNRTTCTLQGILPRLFMNCSIFEQGHNSCCRLIAKKQELALKHWDTVLLFPFSESAPQTASLNIEVIDEEAIPGQLSPHQVLTVAGPYPNTSTIFVKNWSPAKKLTFNISCMTEKTVYPAPQVLSAHVFIVVK